MNGKFYLLIIYVLLWGQIEIFANTKESFVNSTRHQATVSGNSQSQTQNIVKKVITNYVIITNHVIISNTLKDEPVKEHSHVITNSEEIRKLQALEFLKNQEKINEQKRLHNQKTLKQQLKQAPIPQPEHKFFPIEAIVLDAGHGGHDAGGARNGIEEKRLALTLVKKIHTIFRKKNRKIKIYVTRKNDKFVSLEDRVSKTTRWASKKNILFVSVHANIAYNSHVEGIEIYTLSDKASDPEALATERIENAGFSKEDVEQTASFYSILADLIRDSTRKQSEWLAKYVYNSILQKSGGYGRGLKRANFFVLKYNTVPSILIETGFMTNVKEASKLKSEEYQNKIAAGIFIGVSKYINDYNKTEGFTK